MDSCAKPEATGPIEFDLDAAAKAFEGIVGRILEQEVAIGADLAESVAQLLGVSPDRLKGHLTGPAAALQSILHNAIDESWDSERLEMEVELLVERTAGDMRSVIPVQRAIGAAEQRAELTDDRLRELVLQELPAALADIRRDHPGAENKRNIKMLLTQKVKDRLQVRGIVKKSRRIAGVLHRQDFCPD